MRDYTGMGYAEFMAEMDEYIATLKQGDGDALTEAEWTAWIKGEAKNHDEVITDEQIGWIIEKINEDNQEIINKRKALGSEFEEMIALGWTDEEAREDEDSFFERIGDYADGLTHEDVWEVWEAAWEYKMEEAERVSRK